MRRTLLWTILCFIEGFGMVHAEENKPCLIFSGASEQKHVLDIASFNRITFGENSMTISHSDFPENQVELLYSAYHRFEVGDGIPTEITELKDDGDVSLFYNDSEKSLQLVGDKEELYSIGIFGINGTLICRANLCCGEFVSVKALEPAVYIAVAVNGNEIKKIKFIKK